MAVLSTVKLGSVAVCANFIVASAYDTSVQSTVQSKLSYDMFEAESSMDSCDNFQDFSETILTKTDFETLYGRVQDVVQQYRVKLTERKDVHQDFVHISQDDLEQLSLRLNANKNVKEINEASLQEDKQAQQKDLKIQKKQEVLRWVNRHRSEEDKWKNEHASHIRLFKAVKFLLKDKQVNKAHELMMRAELERRFPQLSETGQISFRKKTDLNPTSEGNFDECVLDQTSLATVLRQLDEIEAQQQAQQQPDNPTPNGFAAGQLSQGGESANNAAKPTLNGFAAGQLSQAGGQCRRFFSNERSW